MSALHMLLTFYAAHWLALTICGLTAPVLVAISRPNKGR